MSGSLCLRTRSKKEKQVCEGSEEENQAEEDQIKVGPKWEEEKSLLGRFCFARFQRTHPVHCLHTGIKVTSFFCWCVSELLTCVRFQSEEDFLEESDFDDISIHSASVLSDTLGAATKKKARRGRKKRKSMFTVQVPHALWCPDKHTV